MLDIKVDNLVLVVVEGVKVIGEARSPVTTFPRRARSLRPPLPLIHLASLGVILNRRGYLLGCRRCGSTRRFRCHCHTVTPSCCAGSRWWRSVRDERSSWNQLGFHNIVAESLNDAEKD